MRSMLNWVPPADSSGALEGLPRYKASIERLYMDYILPWKDSGLQLWATFNQSCSTLGEGGLFLGFPGKVQSTRGCGHILRFSA